MTTLFDLTYEIARQVGVVKEGTATGGSSTTVVDTNGRKEALGTWNGRGDDTGTVWILYDAAGAGAAPQGEFGVISAYDPTTSTVTLRTALTQAVAVGDRYGIAKRRYPLYLLVQGVNKALMDLGAIPRSDVTTLTSGNYTEYTLPVAACQDLRAVYVATYTGTSDNRWRPLDNWEIRRTAIGTGDTLVFKNIPPYPYALRLDYMAPHTPLYAATDKLDESIPKELVVVRGVAATLNLYRTKTGDNSRDLLDNIEKWEKKVAELAGSAKVIAPPRRGRLNIISDVRRPYPGDPNAEL